MNIVEFTVEYQEFINAKIQSVESLFKRKILQSDKIYSIIFLIIKDISSNSCESLNEQIFINLKTILMFDCNHFENVQNIFAKSLASNIRHIDIEITTYFNNKEIETWFELNISNKNENYLKNKKENIRKLRLVKYDSYKRYINNNIISIFQLSIYFALNNNEVFNMRKDNKFILLAKCIAYMNSISTDADNLMKDLISANNYSLNCFINFGIRYNYGKYMDYKTKILMLLENFEFVKYSNNFRRLINDFDHKIENFINTTNPDIASSNTFCK